MRNGASCKKKGKMNTEKGLIINMRYKKAKSLYILENSSRFDLGMLKLRVMKVI